MLGHERSLTQIKFNADGDLLFSCSKDNVINVWFSHNGERLGTYEGHNGSVWTVDVDRASFHFFFFSFFLGWPLTLYSISNVAESKFLISGAADNTLRLWAVATGKCLYTWEFPTAVKRVAFNEAGTQVVCITEQRMGYQCAIRVFDIDHRGDGTKRQLLQAFCFSLLLPFVGFLPPPFCQNQKNHGTCSTPSDQKQLSVHSPWHPISSSPVTNQEKLPFLTLRMAKKLKTTSERIVMPLPTYNWVKIARTVLLVVRIKQLGYGIFFWSL